MATQKNHRTPHLGRLGIAILENLVKPVLGDEAIKEIKSPLIAKEEEEAVAHALEKAEQQFTSRYEDTEVGQAIINLPLATLPSIRQVVCEFYTRPNDTRLPQLLRDRLANDFPNWSVTRIDGAVTAYLKILREELVNISSEIREKLRTIATLAMQSDMARMAIGIEHIEAILERIAQGKYTEADIAELRRIVIVKREENIVQLGKYSVPITEGKDFHIGDRIYRGIDAEAIRQVLQSLQPSIHLNVNFQSVPADRPKSEGDSEPRKDDSKPSNIEWEARDHKLLRNYLQRCKKHNFHQMKRLDASDENQVREHLISSGLAGIRDGRTYLTYAGALLCCRWERLPRDTFHVHVKFQQSSELEELPEELFGSVLYLYDELYKRIKPLFERRMGSPNVRDKFGAESKVFEYPPAAIVETLANFLIHRDYSLDDIGFITVYPDRVEFMNPGQSEIPPDELMKATGPLRPVYKRNQRLIEAMNKAGLNQREGGGIFRIRRALEQNGSYLSDGSLGLSIRNDEVNNRFILTIFKRIPKQRISPQLGGVPPLPRLLIGRDQDLGNLKARLATMAREPTSLTRQMLIATRGWPGVGKTALVAALAHDPEMASVFPDGVLWVSLGQNPNLLSELATWGRALGSADLLQVRTLEEASARLRALLRDKRMLLVIDDLWEVQHAIPFMIGGRNCATIITTRVSQVANDLAPTPNDIYRLAELTEASALELLRALAPTVVDQYPIESRELVKELEGLPLAIQVAGHLLNVEASYGFGVPDLMRELREGQKLLEARVPADRLGLANETIPTVAVLLQRSTDRLDSVERNCFASLGSFAPAPATFDLAAMKAVWQVEDPEPIARRLIERGLLEPVPAANRFQIHALLVIHAMSILAQKSTKTSLGNAHFRFAKYYQSRLREANLLYIKGGEAIEQARIFFDIDWPNLQTGQAWAAIHASQDEEVARLCSDYADEGIYLLDLRRGPRERIVWLEAALFAARKLNDRATEGRHLINLGGTYWSLGEVHRAIEFYEQALIVSREIGDRRGEANALGNLGIAHAVLGETRHAIELYEQQLKIAQEIGDRIGEGTALGNLGLDYSELGDAYRAIHLQEKALSIAREIGDRRGESNALGNLGNAYVGLNEPRRAIELYQQAITIDREIGDYRGEGADLVNLGATYAALGELQRAIELYKQALEIHRVIENPRGEADSLWDMSLALHQLGDQAQAIAHAEEALKIYEQIEDPRAQSVRRQLKVWQDKDLKHAESL